jgi:hypothetical protein
VNSPMEPATAPAPSALLKNAVSPVKNVLTPTRNVQHTLTPSQINKTAHSGRPAP